MLFNTIDAKIHSNSKNNGLSFVLFVEVPPGRSVETPSPLNI